jgi:hypothetical protein
MICQWGTDLTITNECDFHNWISDSSKLADFPKNP